MDKNITSAVPVYEDLDHNPLRTKKIVLSVEKNLLNRMIDLRFDKMLASGAIYECQRVLKFCNQYEDIQLLPSQLEDDINSVVDFSPAWPTSGLIAIEFLLQNYDEIYIHGFDSKSKKYEVHSLSLDEPQNAKISELETFTNPSFRDKGAVVVFPSWVRHRVTPVTRGTRYSAVAWFNGPPLR